MEALNPGHVNRLLNYDLDPAQPPTTVTVAQELRRWYEESVDSTLSPPINKEELAELTFFFSSLDSNELLALYGLEQAGRWAKDSELQKLLDQIDDALPYAKAASPEGLESTANLLEEHQNLRRILRPQRGFLRSVLAHDDSTQDYGISKGAIHTRHPSTNDDTVYTYGEVDQSDIALLMVHEVLIRRLAKQDSTRHTRLPFEYSKTHRWLETQARSFSDIEAARHFVGRIATEGLLMSNMNEPYQQGLLSILQNCSLFPDVVACFRNSDRAGFIEMQKKIAQLWPMPGTHGAFAQCGFGFKTGLLRYDGHEVHVAENLQKGLDSLPQATDKLDLARQLQVPLYVGRRSTISFEPTDLPHSNEDARSIKGKLRTYPHRSPFGQHSYTRCPALAGQDSIIPVMAALVYDHAEALRTSDVPAKIIELDDERVIKLTDTPEFRHRISPVERDTWIDEDGTDLLETGAFRSPELSGAYLVETVKPVLLQLGREAAKNTHAGWLEVTAEL